MTTMQAMVLDRAGTPLVMRERPLPAPDAGEIFIAIGACGDFVRSLGAAVLIP